MWPHRAIDGLDVKNEHKRFPRERFYDTLKTDRSSGGQGFIELVQLRRSF